MLSPKKNLSNITNMDNNEILPVANSTSLEEKEALRKDNEVALALKNTQNILLMSKCMSIILEDSITKHLNSWEMSKKVRIQAASFTYNIFAGEKTTCMKVCIPRLLTDGREPKSPLLPKICHTYTTKMKLGIVIPYLKKIPKIYESRDASLSSADISLSSEISKFCYIRKYKCRLHFGYIISNSFDLFLSLYRFLLINTVTILMISVKLATPGFLKIKIFQNKGYDVIILDYNVIKNFITGFKLYCRCGHVTKVC